MRQEATGQVSDREREREQMSEVFNERGKRRGKREKGKGKREKSKEASFFALSPFWMLTSTFPLQDKSSNCKQNGSNCKERSSKANRKQRSSACMELGNYTSKSALSHYGSGVLLGLLRPCVSRSRQLWRVFWLSALQVGSTIQARLLDRNSQEIMRFAKKIHAQPKSIHYSMQAVTST